MKKICGSNLQILRSVIKNSDLHLLHHSLYFEDALLCLCPQCLVTLRTHQRTLQVQVTACVSAYNKGH